MNDFKPLGRAIPPKPKALGPVIERLGPKLWSVDGKFQDTDPTPRPPIVPNWEGLNPIVPETE